MQRARADRIDSGDRIEGEGRLRDRGRVVHRNPCAGGMCGVRRGGRTQSRAIDLSCLIGHPSRPCSRPLFAGTPPFLCRSGAARLSAGRSGRGPGLSRGVLSALSDRGEAVRSPSPEHGRRVAPRIERLRARCGDRSWPGWPEGMQRSCSSLLPAPIFSRSPTANRCSACWWRGACWWSRAIVRGSRRHAVRWLRRRGQQDW